MSHLPPSLYLIELFRSVQGETSFTGKPTTFIRLAACNLRCSWCDTPYSFKRGTPHLLSDIVQKVVEFGCSYVCVTGGEPLLQPNVHALMRQLCDLGYVLSLETSGSLPIKEVDPRVKTILDIKCPGSKMESKNLWENLSDLKEQDEVKFVIADAADYLYAKQVVEKHTLKKRVQDILFSPVFGQLDPKALIEWILRDQLPVRLNLQIHKFIWSPETVGV